jgi:hypothetical protein
MISRANRMKREPRIFLLSPANLGGKCAQILMNPKAEFITAQRLRAGTATIGETFAFLSGLYFRGKLIYSEVFARPPAGINGRWVITSNCGLVDIATPVSISFLRSLSVTPIDIKDPRYRDSLAESSRDLRRRIPADRGVVLLGSIAKGKHADLLSEVFGERLLFPDAFLGRGDLSRGALMLRSAAESIELSYSVLGGETRRKQRSKAERS